MMLALKLTGAKVAGNVVWLLGKVLSFAFGFTLAFLTFGIVIGLMLSLALWDIQALFDILVLWEEPVYHGFAFFRIMAVFIATAAGASSVPAMEQ
ncbi:MAG: hypothetical protein LC687_04015 [Actinobacteria bacterium]|nr:hypothetical protein [Actinomycetota bacterium]